MHFIFVHGTHPRFTWPWRQTITDNITILDADHAVCYFGEYDIIRALSS